jgi:signal peptidase I
MRNWFFYTFLAVFGSAFGMVIVGVVSVRIYQVPNAAMEPTLREGDSLLEFRRFGMRSIQRGELAAFFLPQDSAQTIVRRVVGVPGDHIKVRGGRLVLNGQQLAEPYIQISKNALGADFPTTLDSMLDLGGEVRNLQAVMYGEWVRNGTLIVPDGYYFMLGDNRTNTVDSRIFGPIPVGNILARPVYVYRTKAPGTERHLLDSYIIGDPP